MTRCGAALLVVFLLSGDAPGAPKHFELCGTVRDAEGKPVKGVTVILSHNAIPKDAEVPPFRNKRATDAQGWYSVTVPWELRSSSARIYPPGGSAMRVVRITPEDAVTSIRSTKAASARMDVVLAEGVGTLSGKVTAGVAPAAGVKVVVEHRREEPYRSVDGARVFETTSGPDGTYRLERLLPGKYLVRSLTPPRGSGLVKRYNNYKGWKTVFVPSARATDVDFRLDYGRCIVGRVVDETGRPVKGAKVTAAGGGPAVRGFERLDYSGDIDLTDDEGRYKLEGLLTNTFTMTVTPPTGSGLAPIESMQGITLSMRGDRIMQDLVLVRGGTLEGTVRDADGEPVAGARVLIGSRWSPRFSTTTDRRGRYALKGLPSGAHDLRVEPPADSVWIPQLARRVRCLAGLRLPLDWTLKKGGIVHGIVTDARGTPVAGARLRVGLNNAGFETTTDRNGGYRLVGVAGQNHIHHNHSRSTGRLRVYPPVDVPCLTYTAKLDILLGVDHEVDIVLEKAGAVWGKVTDADGNGVKGVRVKAFTTDARGRAKSRGHGWAHGVLTDADGVFKLVQLPAGQIELRVAVPKDVNFLNVTGHTVEVISEEAVLTAITLEKGGVVAGTVTDDAGKPHAWAEVQLAKGSPGWRRMQFSFAGKRNTDRLGRFRFEKLTAGCYMAQVWGNMSGRALAPIRFDLARSETKTLKLVSRRAGTIEVKVTDADDKPLVGVGVLARNQDEKHRRGRGAYSTRKSGISRLRGLPPGTYTVLVMPRYAKLPFEPTELKDVVVPEGGTVNREVKLKKTE